MQSETHLPLFSSSPRPMSPRVLLPPRPLQSRFIVIIALIALFYYTYYVFSPNPPWIERYFHPTSSFPLAPPPPPPVCNATDGIYVSGQFFRFNNESISENVALAVRPTAEEAVYPPLPLDWDTPEVPRGCLDAYLARGIPCGEPALEKMDVLWSYINSSDPLIQDAFLANREMAWHERWRPRPKLGSFRQFDELRHSIRSMLERFRPSARNFFVVGTDVPLPGCDGWRAGQHPQWLSQNTSEWRDGDVSLISLHHHAIYPPLHDQSIFNPYSVETRLHHTPGLSKYYVHMNDDFFANSDITNLDYYSSEYGPVFRLQADLPVKQQGPRQSGEWEALSKTSALLDARYGRRARAYIAHMPKTLAVHFIREVETIWKKELDITASHSFRFDMDRGTDIYTGYLMTQHVIERWREALLWSFFVASVGGDNDEWDEDLAWEKLGGLPGWDVINVVRGRRDTLRHVEDRLSANGFEPKTQFVYSSLDGFPYSGYGNPRQPFMDWPDWKHGTPTHPASSCTISRLRCFEHPAKVNATASEMFKYAAFKNTQCGDCILDALVVKSGNLGLEAFLPGASRRIKAPSWPGGAQLPPPRLPLGRSWRTTDFTLRSVINRNDLSVREWVEQAILRYRFMLGQMPFEFVMVRQFKDLRRVFRIDDGPAVICVNDDVSREEEDVEWGLAYWFWSKWPEAAKWEVQGAFFDPVWTENDDEES